MDLLQIMATSEVRSIAHLALVTGIGAAALAMLALILAVFKR